MRRINISQSPMTILLRYCAFVLSRLRGNPALTQEATLLEQAETELLASAQNNQTAIEVAMAALAVRETKQYELDVALRAVRLAVLSLVRNNRGSRIYRMIFPNGFVDVLRSNPLDEINQARNVLRSLVEIQSPALEPVTAGLQAAVDALLVATTDSATAVRAETDSRVALLNAKIRFASQYDEIYHRLTNILGDWRLAETYFRRFRKVTMDPAPVAETQPKPAPTERRREQTPTSTPSPARRRPRRRTRRSPGRRIVGHGDGRPPAECGRPLPSSLLVPACRPRRGALARPAAQRVGAGVHEHQARSAENWQQGPQSESRLPKEPAHGYRTANGSV